MIRLKTNKQRETRTIKCLNNIINNGWMESRIAVEHDLMNNNLVSYLGPIDRIAAATVFSNSLMYAKFDTS